MLKFRLPYGCQGMLILPIKDTPHCAVPSDRVIGITIIPLLDGGKLSALWILFNLEMLNS